MNKFLSRCIILCILILIFTMKINFAQEPKIDEQIEIHLENGIEFANQKQFDKAIEELKKALELDETDINTLCALGTVYVYKNMYKEAIDVLREAIKADPTASVPYYVLAMVYEKQEDYQKAITQWRNFIKFSSNKELIKTAKKHLERLEDIKNE